MRIPPPSPARRQWTYGARQPLRHAGRGRPRPLHAVRPGPGRGRRGAGAAQASIRAGCSLGHRTSAELLFHADDGDGGTPLSRARRFAELIAHVDPADEHAYWGFARPDARELLRTVVDDQAAKASGTYRSVAARYGAVRRRITST
ncbi:MAG: hypothetical protein ABS81_17015 [Pseudonocardia sp. SCN 72-86]|nr:MAG: hypothetical protein ABS81_17015 [Pseudonocardia sp. SCN 72-86]